MAPFQHRSQESLNWSTFEDDEPLVLPPPRSAKALSTPGRELGEKDTTVPEPIKEAETGLRKDNESANYAPGLDHEQHSFARPQAAEPALANPPTSAEHVRSLHDKTKVHSGDLRDLGPKVGFSPGVSAGGLDLEERPRMRSSQSSLSAALSLASSPAESTVDGGSWTKKPKDAAFAALRYLGLASITGKSGRASPQAAHTTNSMVEDLLEFALAIVLATAADCTALAESAQLEDKKALMCLRSLAREHGLLGRVIEQGLGTAAALSATEIASAFIATQEQTVVQTKPRHSALMRAMSTTSMLSTNSKATNLETRARPQLQRKDSTASIKSGVRGAFHRSPSHLSEFSVNSYSSSHPRQLGAEAAPAFLEFLNVVLTSQKEGGSPSRLQRHGTNASIGSEGNTFLLDLQLPDNDSESSIAHATIGVEGGEKEAFSAEVVNIGDSHGFVNVQIAFKSRSLRTQNEWQRQLISQQRALLDVVTGKLRAAEKSLQADGEVMAEERELLRGFRKIVRREPGNEDTQTPVEIFVVESRSRLKSEMQELCTIMSYSCSMYDSCDSAGVAIEEASQSTIKRVVSCMSMQSGKSGKSMLSSYSAVSTELLGDRPGADLGDWRSRAVCTAGKSVGNVMLESPIQIVLLGIEWLATNLPPAWQETGVRVVLISEADEFEQVGIMLRAAGESEIRERLREKGICDYLISPLSLDSLSTVILQAEQSRFDEYLLLGMLGRGATAAVHRAKRLRDTEVIALKEVNTRRLTQLARDEIEREIALLRELSWPTVVFMLDTWENANEKLRYLVMPLLEEGSVSQRIEQARDKPDGQEGPPYSTDLVADWYVQTIHGLCYMHWRGIIHRDIKPGNLLIGRENRSLQIGDLGSAMLLPGKGPFPNRYAMVKAPVCTPLFSSPEGLLQETHLASSDLWCVGVSFYEALTLHPLFPRVSNLSDAQQNIRAFDPSMAAPSNGKTNNTALAAFSTMNQIRSSSSSKPEAAELAGELPQLLRPDYLERPPASKIGARSTWLKRLKGILVQTGAITKASEKTHFEYYKTVLKESYAAVDFPPEAAGLPAIADPTGRGPRPPRR